MSPQAELVLGEVRKAMQQATDKHGPLPLDPLRALRVLVEEVGEVATAIDLIRTSSNQPLLEMELRQVASVALLWLENIEQMKPRYRGNG